jgi:hypothetical protein
MRDKSQIDDMRAALRGDLERARERRGATLLDPAPEPEPQAPDTQEPEPELRAEVSDTPIEAPEADTMEPTAAEDPESRTWVSDTPIEAAEPPAPVSDTQQPAEIQEPGPKRRRFLWFLDG